MPLLRGYPRSDVRHVPVVREQIRLADARSRVLDDGVPRMREPWFRWFMVDADPQRPRQVMATMDAVPFVFGFYTLSLPCQRGSSALPLANVCRPQIYRLSRTELESRGSWQRL